MEKIRITLDDLENHNACEAGTREFIRIFGEHGVATANRASIAAATESNRLDAPWIMRALYDDASPTASKAIDRFERAWRDAKEAEEYDYSYARDQLLSDMKRLRTADLDDDELAGALGASIEDYDYARFAAHRSRISACLISALELEQAICKSSEES
jgi:hypothetical protein